MKIVFCPRLMNNFIFEISVSISLGLAFPLGIGVLSKALLNASYNTKSLFLVGFTRRILSPELFSKVYLAKPFIKVTSEGTLVYINLLFSKTELFEETGQTILILFALQ